jgi:hypothetical protein
MSKSLKMTNSRIRKSAGSFARRIEKISIENA